MRGLIVNADDYAMDAATDAAILELASKRAVTAASAMVLSRRWPEAARAAMDAPPLSFGLHLDLTSPFAGGALAPQKLPVLMARSKAGVISKEELRKVIGRQLSLFEAALKAPPAFVDGHQHVHQFPIVRDVLLEALSRHYGAGKARIGLRICTARRWRGIKAGIIARTGAAGLAKLAEANGHRVNTDFAGVYNFAPNTRLAPLWQTWLQTIEGDLPLIMCHVSKPSEDYPRWDGIRAARCAEFTWLSSEEFQQMRMQLSLSPVSWP